MPQINITHHIQTFALLSQNYFSDIRIIFSKIKPHWGNKEILLGRKGVNL